MYNRGKHNWDVRLFASVAVSIPSAVHASVAFNPFLKQGGSDLGVRPEMQLLQLDFSSQRGGSDLFDALMGVFFFRQLAIFFCLPKFHRSFVPAAHYNPQSCS